MSGLISKIRGTPQHGTEADLKKSTESGILEIPEDLLDRVAEASNGEDDRQLIMKHLRECLSEPNGKKWKRVYAALVVTSTLVEKGSAELFSETAQGVHFDIAQRVSLLEHYAPGGTIDAQGKSKVRNKASEIRSDLIARLQRAATGEEAGGAVPSKSGGADANSSSSTCTGSAESPSKGPPAAAGQLILNGIVAVGHNDDTTSESSGGEGAHRKAVEYKERKQIRKTGKQRQSHDSEDPDDAADSQRRKAGVGDLLSCMNLAKGSSPAPGCYPACSATGVTGCFAGVSRANAAAASSPTAASRSQPAAITVDLLG